MKIPGINKKKVIFLMGPTACGKTDLAITLSKYLPIELISVDSGLIYREMDIGTAKPSNCKLLETPHRLVNIKDPIESYSVFDFQNDVIREINDIFSLGKIPCLVGGTMFYYKILLEGLAPLPSSDKTLRQNILSNRYKNGRDTLHQQLSNIDSIAAKRIHPNDHQRILRALEVFFISGKTMTSLLKAVHFSFPYSICQFVIMPFTKFWLHKKIEIRFNKMLLSGFQEEVQKLINRGDLNVNFPSIRRVGYSQMWRYLCNSITYEKMIFETICSTNRLAKHQITWLKKWKNAYFLQPKKNVDILAKKILYILSKIFFSNF